MLGQPIWYRFTRRKGHRAPIAAPRYRWTTVCGMAGWWHVDDLEAFRAGRGGAVIRTLPLGRTVHVLDAWFRGNGGW